MYYLHTALLEGMTKCAHKILLELCCRNKSRLSDSAFNMFFSFVHGACIDMKTRCMFALRGGMAKKFEIFNSSQWHYSLYCWCASKLANSSFRWLPVNFFRQPIWSKHFMSLKWHPIIYQDWIKGSASFQFSGSPSVIPWNKKKSSMHLVVLSKYSTNV